jgi:hypothetical protein
MELKGLLLFTHLQPKIFYQDDLLFATKKEWLYASSHACMQKIWSTKNLREISQCKKRACPANGQPQNTQADPKLATQRQAKTRQTKEEME